MKRLSAKSYEMNVLMFSGLVQILTEKVRANVIRIWITSIILILLTGLIGYADENKSPSGFETIETDYFSLHYPEGLEPDARKINDYLMHAAKAMLIEFSAYDPDALLRTTNCNVFIYKRANDKVSESRALAYTEVKGGRYFVDLHFLAPSAHSKSARNNMGEPKDDKYFFKTVVHEYSTIILKRLTRQKAGGWRFHNAPRWFVQGYEDYLGLMNSSEYSKKVTFKNYLKHIGRNPDSISFDMEQSEIFVKKPYVDGTILLAFMHDTYGKDKVQSVLINTSPTFYEALFEALGDDLPGFSGKFEKWRDLTTQK